jgi:hypothetical protein
MTDAALIKRCRAWQKIAREAYYAAAKPGYAARRHDHDLYEGLCTRSKSLAVGAAARNLDATPFSALPPRMCHVVTPCTNEEIKALENARAAMMRLVDTIEENLNAPIRPRVVPQQKPRRKRSVDSATEARDRWIYQQGFKGAAFTSVAFRLTKKPKSWARIDSKQGIQQAAARYANRHDLPRFRPIVQISTDGFQSYPEVVDLAFGPYAKYGQILKEYRNASMIYTPSEMVGAKRTGIQGIGPRQERTICTSHVERLNGIQRVFMKRLNRLTLCFSKKLRNLEAAFAMFAAYYNYCWQTRKPGKSGQKRGTAAMMAGLAGHVWSFDELFDAVLTTNIKGS